MKPYNLKVEIKSNAYFSYYENEEDDTPVQIRTSITPEKTLSRYNFQILKSDEWTNFYEVSDELYKSLNEEFIDKKYNPILLKLVEERDALKIKIKELISYMDSPIDSDLFQHEHKILQQQNRIMVDYLNTLNKRILATQHKMKNSNSAPDKYLVDLCLYVNKDFVNIIEIQELLKNSKFENLKIKPDSSKPNCYTIFKTIDVEYNSYYNILLNPNEQEKSEQKKLLEKFGIKEFFYEFFDTLIIKVIQASNIFDFNFSNIFSFGVEEIINYKKTRPAEIKDKSFLTELKCVIN